jgi:pyruvate formate lyase activating enzyme
MRITGLMKESFQDWEEGLTSVIFAGNCNYLCHTCHGRELLEGENEYNENEVLSWLARKKQIIPRTTICGGEPTTQYDLIDFTRKLKKIGLRVKLDTNGSNPEILNELLKEKLVDYVAIDIKGPPNLYNQLIGKEIDLRDCVEKGIGIVCQFPDYEFRTTAVPFEKNGEYNWFNEREAKNMALWVYHFSGITNDFDNTKWYIQKFIAREKEKMIDEKFSIENLPCHMHETPQLKLEEIKDAVRLYFPNARIR